MNSDNSKLRNLSKYGSVFADLLDVDRLNELGPGTPDPKTQDRLARLTTVELFSGVTIRDEDMAACCLAGVWLFHDCLEESHEVSQGIQTPTGSYWHGIMHRREPDDSNANYWFRKVGAHAVWQDLTDAIDSRRAAAADPTDVSSGRLGDLTANGTFDPFAFLDLCRQCRIGESELSHVCRSIANDEWWLLFDYCYRSAIDT